MKDLDHLLQPISTENPCGIDIEETLPYSTEFQTLESMSCVENSQDFSESDAAHSDIDWREIERIALSLFGAGKHLRLAVYLSSAWLHMKNFEGFAQGIKLVRQLNEQYWEEAYPKLTFDGDLDADFRINALNNLCDADAIIKPLTRAKLFSVPGLGSFSLRDYKLALGEITHHKNDQAITLQQIEAALKQLSPDIAQEHLKLIQGIREDLEAIEAWTEDKLKGQSYQPLSLTPLNKEMIRIEKFLRSHPGAEKAHTAPSDNKTSTNNPETAMPVTQSLAQPGTINNRDDVTRSLDKICDYYRANEPSSPVPLLLGRAKALVTANFLEIIGDLNPDGLQKIKDLGGKKVEPTDNKVANKEHAVNTNSNSNASDW